MNTGLLMIGLLFNLTMTDYKSSMKRRRGRKLVVDLSALSYYVTLTPFRMETVALVLGSVRKEGVLFLITLKDVQFQIPIYLDSQPHLCMALSVKVHQFMAHCFSLSTVLQVFTVVFVLISQVRDLLFSVS